MTKAQIAQSKKKPMVLIVDDVPKNLQVLGSLLGQIGCDIAAALNGRQALEISSKISPDLILLDVQMPELTGFEVCKRLKHSPKTKDIPVIFITAEAETDDVIKGFELGAVDYVTKPFIGIELLARVKTHLELKRYRDTLEEQSRLDGLTGIPNRRRFDSLLAMHWKQGVREGRPLSLIMVDIDNFKAYNDRYGHQAGDDCLKSVAETLSKLIRRPMDFAARYGGEEFVCLLPFTAHEGAVLISENLRAGVEAKQIPHAGSDTGSVVTISLGAATMVPTKDSSPKTLVEAADKKLYEAKKSGKNQARSIILESPH